MDLAAHFLSKIQRNISNELRFGLFSGHSNTFSFKFAIFSWTSFDIYHGPRSYWNVYADLFRNLPIDCVNSCCSTSQYNVPLIVPSKLRGDVVVALSDMPTLLPSPVFKYSMQSGSSHSSSVLQIFTWFFCLRT